MTAKPTLLLLWASLNFCIGVSALSLGYWWPCVVQQSVFFFFKLTFIYNNVSWKAFGKLLEDGYKLVVDSKWHTLLFLTQLSRVDSLPILLNKWIVIYAGAVCSHYRLGYINSNSITQTAVPEMTYCLTLMLDVWPIFANVMSFSKGLSPRSWEEH